VTLKGKRAVVTGGTRGIGVAIAKRLSDAGATVRITGVKGPAPHGWTFHAVDFTDEDATRKFGQFIAETDILVNSAGINKLSSFESLNLQDYNDIQAVNVRAPLLLCQAVVPYMRKQKWGRIVNISSVFGIVSKELRAAYSASKFALNGLTTALAAEVAVDNVLVNCVAPGFIDTDMTRQVLGSDDIVKLIERVPMRRLGRPEEVAALVAWLAGPENTFISGQTIVIDGGFTRV
jgi:NAD(P)-dependent dehydrogenase (short-subunit alcohol dehydrogenase family)